MPFSGLNLGLLDSRYFRLDASNAPITGDTLIKPTTNSTNTLEVQQSGGTQVFNVDTTNQSVTALGRDILIYSFMLGDF